MGDMKSKISKKWISLLLFSICGIAWFFLRKDSSSFNYRYETISGKNAYFIPIKIKGFTRAHIPYLEIAIEGKKVEAKIDLGYAGDVTLPSKVLHELNEKTFIAEQSSYGLTGKTYKNKVYRAPKVSIEDIQFSSIRIEEVNTEFEHDISLGETENGSNSLLGRVGWHLFYNFNVLIDCEHSTLGLCDSLTTLKQHGYPVESFTEAPLLLDRGFLEFEAETDFGSLRCVLDTGSTWNMFNRNSDDSCVDYRIFTAENTDQYAYLNPENANLMAFDSKDTQDTSIFRIAGKDFGPITFSRVQSPLAIDAIIGVEFFESTLIFIDFSNRKIYFHEPKEVTLN